jgi:hypothetical protein
MTLNAKFSRDASIQRDLVRLDHGAAHTKTSDR